MTRNEIRNFIIYIIRTRNPAISKIIFQLMEIFYKNKFNAYPSEINAKLFSHFQDRVDSNTQVTEVTTFTDYGTRIGSKTHTEVKKGFGAHLAEFQWSSLKYNSLFQFINNLDSQFAKYIDIKSETSMDLSKDKIERKLANAIASVLVDEFGDNEVSTKDDRMITSICEEISGDIITVVQKHCEDAASYDSIAIKNYISFAPKDYRKFFYGNWSGISGGLGSIVRDLEQFKPLGLYDFGCSAPCNESWNSNYNIR